MVIFQKDDSLCKQFKRWQEENKEEDFGLVRFLLIGIGYFYFFIVCEIVGVVSVALTWTRRRQSGQNCYMEERGEYGKKRRKICFSWERTKPDVKICGAGNLIERRRRGG